MPCATPQTLASAQHFYNGIKEKIKKTSFPQTHFRKRKLFTQAELRLSTLMRECTAIIYRLTECEFLILIFLLPDTLSRKTPPDFLIRKTTVEITENIKFFLAKEETSPRLQGK